MKNYFSLLILVLFIFAGCAKMEEKKTPPTQNSNGQNQTSPSGELPPNHPPIGKDNQQQTDAQTESGKDEGVAKYKKEAEDADARYEKDKSEANRKAVIEKNLSAGNYMMFEANVPPKEKYRPALKYYRKVLAIDPKNEEAAVNKDKIEEIYTQMGLPIPQ
jgi:tetratricopeptide (TPR) repeat protein